MCGDTPPIFSGARIFLGNSASRPMMSTGVMAWRVAWRQPAACKLCKNGDFGVEIAQTDPAEKIVLGKCDLALVVIGDFCDILAPAGMAPENQPRLF